MHRPLLDCVYYCDHYDCSAAVDGPRWVGIQDAVSGLNVKNPVDLFASKRRWWCRPSSVLQRYDFYCTQNVLRRRGR